MDYKEWEALKDEIFKLKKEKQEMIAHLKEIRWLAGRKYWHPGTRIKYIRERLSEMGV